MTKTAQLKDPSIGHIFKDWPYVAQTYTWFWSSLVFFFKYTGFVAVLNWHRSTSHIKVCTWLSRPAVSKAQRCTTLSWLTELLSSSRSPWWRGGHPAQVPLSDTSSCSVVLVDSHSLHIFIICKYQKFCHCNLYILWWSHDIYCAVLWGVSSSVALPEVYSHFFPPRIFPACITKMDSNWLDLIEQTHKSSL